MILSENPDLKIINHEHISPCPNELFEERDWSWRGAAVV